MRALKHIHFEDTLTGLHCSVEFIDGSKDSGVVYFSDFIQQDKSYAQAQDMLLNWVKAIQ